MLQSENEGLTTEQWLKQIPEDVFYAGALFHKRKGSYKYQSMWGVLRFESAMGPKRLELFEPGSKEKCFVINANIYPLTTVPFTQTLGLHPDHTLRPGIFPFKVLTTDKKYYLATKTKEEQQEWQSKINTLLHGTPLPNRTCEYMVMVFPTKNSEEMNLRGQYIFKVTENNVHLISRDSSIHTAFKIPLSSIVRANHTVFYKSSIQFAPLSDRKSTIKALALTVEMDCNLGKKGYVFAATSAAEIATIVNERRARVCRLRPDTATPTSVHPFPPAKSPHTNEEFLSHTEVLQLMGSIKQDSTRMSARCGRTSPLNPPLPISANKTKSFPRYRVGSDPDNCLAVPSLHSKSTMPHLYSGSLGALHANTMPHLYSGSPGALHANSTRPNLYSGFPGALHANSPSHNISDTSQGNLMAEKKPEIVIHHREQQDSQKDSFSTAQAIQISRTGSHNSLATVGCPTNNGAGLEPSIVEIQALSQPMQTPCYDHYTGSNLVTGDEEDSLSLSNASSILSQDIINKSSPTDNTPAPLVCYTNPTRGLVCSKIHQWDESGPCCTEAGPQKDKWEHLKSVTSSNCFQRSRSMADLDESLPHQHTTSAGMDFPQELTYSPTHAHRFQLARSNTEDTLSISNCNGLPLSNPATTNDSHSQLSDSTMEGSHVSPYCSIPHDGLYEQVPKVKWTDIMAMNNFVHTRHYSDSTAPPSCWQDRTCAVTFGAEKETDQDYYEGIKNSGPYEQVPHVVFHDASKFPTPVQAPSALPPRREQLLHRNIPTTRNVGNYKSIQKDSTLLLPAIRKRCASLGDLIDTCGSDETERECKMFINSNSSRKPTLDEPMSSNHHFLNLECPEEETSPPPLPYAVVWIER